LNPTEKAYNTPSPLIAGLMEDCFVAQELKSSYPLDMSGYRNAILNLSHKLLLFAVLSLFLRAVNGQWSSQWNQQLTYLLMDANKVHLLVFTTTEATFTIQHFLTYFLQLKSKLHRFT